MNTINLRHIISFLSLVLFMFFAIGTGGDDADIEEDVSGGTVAATLTSTELSADYAENEINADDKYKDKIIVVSGVISDIGKDVFDDMYIDLPGLVRCSFSESQTDKAKTLKRGDKVSLKGKCDGKTIWVSVKGCIIQ